MKCPFCDAPVEDGSVYCYNCGAEVGTGSPDSEVITAPPDIGGASDSMPQSTGGSLIGSFPDQGGAAVASFPSGNPVADLERVKGWNWGAFVFSWIWAFSHNLGVVAVISLIASFLNMGLFASIFLGITGNEYAWKARRFNSVEEFKDTQRKWTIAGLMMLFFSILLFFAFVMIGVFSGANN